MEYPLWAGGRLEIEAESLAAYSRKVRDEFAALRWGRDMYRTQDERTEANRKIRQLIHRAHDLRQHAKELRSRCEAMVESQRLALYEEKIPFRHSDSDDDRLGLLEVEAAEANRAEQALAAVHIALNLLQCILQLEDEYSMP